MQVTGNYQQVRIKPDQNGHDWDFLSPWGDHHGHGDFPTLQLPVDSGPQIISVEIMASGGPNQVTFQADPLGVAVGSPPHQGQTNGQLTWLPGPTNQKIWLIDWNTNVANAGTMDLNYKLYVNNHDPLDPIIKNGGTATPPPPPPPPPPPTGTNPGQAGTAVPPPGPPSHKGGVDIQWLVIGLVIGLIIGFLLCWWRRKSTDRTVA